jgi:hypothetical protein
MALKVILVALLEGGCILYFAVGLEMHFINM